METMIKQEKNGISYLQFKKLLEFPEIKHMYVLKNGDLNFKRKGKTLAATKQLEENYKTVCSLENMNYKNVIRPTQKHTDCIKCVYQKQGEGPDIYIPEYEDVDGLLTNKRELVLSTTNADCNLILLYDTKQKVIGNIHSGWKGTFKKIALKAVNKMKDEYGSNPEDIIAFLAPSLRKCCFEVHSDVEEPCKEIFNYTNRISDIISKVNEDTYYIDTVLINKLLLEEAGLKKENIIDSGICSKCNSNEIHSRRAEGENYGVGTLLVSLS